MSTPPDLPLRSLDRTLDRLRATPIAPPPTGWLRAIREALGMSMAQFGRRLGLPRQGVLALEHREANGAVTIKTLREAAAALDAELVYAIVPRRSLARMLEAQAFGHAAHELNQHWDRLPLGEQGSDEEWQVRVRERTAALMLTRPRSLWNDVAATPMVRQRSSEVPARPAAAPFRPQPDAT